MRHYSETEKKDILSKAVAIREASGMSWQKIAEHKDVGVPYATLKYWLSHGTEPGLVGRPPHGMRQVVREELGPVTDAIDLIKKALGVCDD